MATEVLTGTPSPAAPAIEDRGHNTGPQQGVTHAPRRGRVDQAVATAAANTPSTAPARAAPPAAADSVSAGARVATDAPWATPT
ncbi:hypothetical protein Slala04_29310 [Streptomyces lavendulae subsp. lavendulae]|nr:hypothetical protein Slala04_29310 [Streptomyces lavendulae subsp. lavendulae]